MSDTTTSTTKLRTISAVVICHQDKQQLIEFLDSLKQQTRQPDEVIACVCCMELDGIDCDIIVKSPHREDWGAEKCEQGLKLATSDYVWYANTDDKPSERFLERLLGEDGDIIACDFNSRHVGQNAQVAPVVGQITRGSFIVRRELALTIGYTDRTYNADGIHAKAVAESGKFVRVPETLYEHR